MRTLLITWVEVSLINSAFKTFWFREVFRPRKGWQIFWVLVPLRVRALAKAREATQAVNSFAFRFTIIRVGSNLSGVRPG